jgi:hypothetical protein
MYKAFIASTFEDLSEHRAEARRALVAAGFVVEQMENWPADRGTPVKFSAARVAGCNLCILLVAFRLGAIPEGESRSVTQIEYEEAKRRRIDVLPFLLADQTRVGQGHWNLNHDERRIDPAIHAWRTKLRQTHGVGEFGSDPQSLRIDAALARWVVQAESDRASRFRLAVTGALVSCLLVAALVTVYAWHVYNTPELRSLYHSRYLALSDPEVFNSARDGRYSVARVLAGTGVLREDTNLNAELGATEVSLDLLANNAQNIHDQLSDTLKGIIERGARVRFILWDYTTENRTSYDAFQEAIHQKAAEPREVARRVRRDLEQLQKDVAAQRAVYRGRFELRWNRRPLFYTMWIRDWAEQHREKAVGHLGVHFYIGQDQWPSFRVSAQSAPKLLDDMHREFENAWDGSAAIIPPE